MKTRKKRVMVKAVLVDLKFWYDTVEMLSKLITFAEYNVNPKMPGKEELLTQARVIWVKAKKADQLEPG